jgi:hypothetical protein
MCVWPPLRAGTDGHDGCAFDGAEGLQHEVRHRGERTGVAGADHGGRATVLHQVDRQAHGGVLAAANGLARVLVHAHDARRRVHLRARAHGSRRCRERGFDDLGFSDEDELERRVGFEGAQGTGYAFGRTAVTTHHIDGDGRHASGRGPRRVPPQFILRSRRRPASR